MPLRKGDDMCTQGTVSLEHQGKVSSDWCYGSNTHAELIVFRKASYAMSSI